MKRIIILEDEITSKMILENTLSHYDLVVCESIAEARDEHRKKPADFYILDIYLPDGAVFPFVQEIINDNKDAGIYIASSDANIENHLRSLKMGALDFFPKPFNPLVLKVKIANFFERANKDQERQEILYKEIKLDPNKQVVLNLENDTNLGPFTKTEFKILEYLLEAKGRVLSREQILENCIGEEHNSTLRAVDTHIAKIRKKLGKYSNYVKSSHGLGYCAQ
ncbi:MAG: response regulator transcription factor [Bdellovibrionota bacterium]|nr:response regulator transcription factor [Bdellovibrionota bacterium]